MSDEFAQQVVLITGACGNLGQAVTARFAAAGARLVLADHDAARLPSLHDRYPDAMTLALDATKVESVDQALHAVEARLGQIHILAHTVGGSSAGQPVHEMPQDAWDRMFNLNVKPIYVVGGRVAQHMLDHAVRGSLVFVLARAALKGAANAAAYTASKAAAQRIMESMAAELKDRGININGVLPSIIDTPPNREAMPKADFSKWVTPEDVANAIAFLASEQANSLHGVSLEVYGRV